MGLFDSLKNEVGKAVRNAANKTENSVFSKLPDTLEEFKALPQAAMSTPFDTAAMTVLALCFYPKDKDLSLAMLDFLRGPAPMSGMDKQNLADPLTQ